MGVLNTHDQTMRRSAQIARFQMECQLDKQFLSPLDVIRVLNREKISFVLVGAYGLSGWMHARATEDVDVVVAARQVGKAVRARLALGGVCGGRRQHAAESVIRQWAEGDHRSDQGN